MADSNDRLFGAGGFISGAVFGLLCLLLAAAMMQPTSCISINRQPVYQTAPGHDQGAGTRAQP